MQPMKKIFIPLLILLFTASITQSQVQIQWQKCYGGSSPDGGNSIVQTADGGYAIGGRTYSNDGDVNGNNGGIDFWIAKLDIQGNVQWQKCLGGTSGDYLKSLIHTIDGGYALAGTTGSNNGYVSGYNGGLYDAWVVKLDSLGNLQWQKCLGGTNQDEASAIIQTIDGGFAIGGYTNSNDGDVSGNNGGYDFWIVKLDPQGNMQWQKCIGGSGNEYAKSIIQTSDNGFAIAGHTSSNDGDASGNHGGGDAWVVKLDPMGNIQWQKCLGGTGNDGANAIIQTLDGGYAVAGETNSNDGDVSGNNGSDDFWVIKLDSQGNIQWQKCLGGTDYEIANSIIQNNSGSYVVVGITYSNDGDVSGHRGGADAWIVKLDSVGNLLWQKSLGGSNNDEARDIIQTLDGRYALIGTASSNNGDVSGNLGFGDIWVVKLIIPNISGKLFHDVNENGQLDPCEQGVAGHLVKLEPGPHYTFTNNEGMYYFVADSGTHTVSYVPYGYWITTGDSSYNLTIDSAGHYIDTLHFGIKHLFNVNDVAVYITGSATRVGFETYYWLTYKNWGTVTASGTVHFEYDSLLTFISSTYTPASHTANILVFDYDTLGPGAQRTIRADFQMPGIQHFGDTLYSNAWITPIVPDTNTVNNYDTIVQIITAAYDPNDKLVMPEGYGTLGYILHGERLTYTIRFQNTGTDTAFTVVLRDTLSPHLDISTILFEAWSHDMTYELHTGNELFFIFNNILLPDSNVNEPESHGFVRFSISPKSGLAEGTQVTNTAYIFFDYNPAIITNTMLNTYVSQIPLSSPALQKEKPKLTLYPNPSSERIFINLPEHTRKAEVYDINGRLLRQITPQSPVLEINISDLPAGMYFVKLYTGNGVVNTKFVRE